MRYGYEISVVHHYRLEIVLHAAIVTLFMGRDMDLSDIALLQGHRYAVTTRGKGVRGRDDAAAAVADKRVAS